MHLCSRQIGVAVSATELVSDLKRVHDLRALVLPGGPLGQVAKTAAARREWGPRGRWLAEAMPRLRTLLYVDPQFAIAAALEAEPWRRTMDAVCQSLVEANMGSLSVGRVLGDDLTDRIDSLLQMGIPLAHRSAGADLREFGGSIHSARVAIGAAPYVDAVVEGSRVVIGGSASPGALAMGFLHSDAAVDRGDWNALATTMVHAIVVEQASLSLEFYQGQNLALHAAPWTGPELAERQMRQGLEAVVGTQGTIELADLTITATNPRIELGGHGGWTVAGITGGPPSGEVPLEILYPLGYEAHLVVDLPSPGLVDEAQDLGQRIESMHPYAADPFSKRGTRVFLQQPLDPASGRRALAIDIFAPERKNVAEIVAQIRNLMVAVPEFQGEALLDPEICVHLERWPTTVPRDEVEWDVEIRAAAEWA